MAPQTLCTYVINDEINVTNNQSVFTKVDATALLFALAHDNPIILHCHTINYLVLVGTNMRYVPADEQNKSDTIEEVSTLFSSGVSVQWRWDGVSMSMLFGGTLPWTTIFVWD